MSSRCEIDEQPYDRVKHVHTPIQLPSGRFVRNRLVKVALYEHMGALFGGPPNQSHWTLYSRWARGRWGMIVTGNVQVSSDHLTLGRDMVIPEHLSPTTLEPFRRLAESIHSSDTDKGNVNVKSSPAERTLAILQLSHPGRQSVNLIGGRMPFVPPVAPSRVALRPKVTGGGSSLLSSFVHTLFFQSPREMSPSEIQTMISSFVRGAEVAASAGFDGVQLHAAHGYLISQFISPKTNLREDEYSVQDGPLLFLYRIATAIRASDIIPADFVLGVKLNSADYVESSSETGLKADSATEPDRAIEHLREISLWGIFDFVEISGGDYEDPSYMTGTGSPRQAFFAAFAREAMQALHSTAADPGEESEPRKPPLILLTGGFRALPLLSAALEQDHAHLLGIGRLSVICPDLPRRLTESIARTEAGEADDFLAEPFRGPDVVGLAANLPPDAGFCTRWLAWCKKAFILLVLLCLRYMPFEPPKLIGAGAEMAWYVVMMRHLGVGREVDYSIGSIEAVFRMWLWMSTYLSARILLNSSIAMGALGIVFDVIIGVLL